ncbi:T5orf172 domain-containing protein [Trichoderma barbatum]
MPNVYGKRSGLNLHDGTTATNSSTLLTPPRTPSPTPDTAAKSNQPSSKDIDPAVLKTRLDLQDGRCGCLTKQKKPCKIITPEKNGSKVDSLVESMIALTQSSLELDGRLQDLAKLVHCHFHDHEKHIESRVEKWILIFPTGAPDAKPVFRLERQIKLALRRDYTHCIGKTKMQRDCRSKLGGQKIQNYFRTIDEIIKSVVGFEDTKIGYLLKVLAFNGLCSSHQYQSHKHIESWSSRIMDIRSTYQAESMKLVDDCTLDGSSISDKTSHADKVQSSMFKNNTKHNLETQDDSTAINLGSLSPAQYWPEAFDESAFEIIERSDRLQDREYSHNEIKANATRPLDEKSGDLKSGFIYLYTVKGNEELVKIGYTTRSPEVRHEEWKISCNRDPKPLYQDSIAPNAHRIEALCHAELDYCRTRVYCTGCLTQHTEWFEITPRDAISVIQKWSNWMASHPYIKTLSESGVKWVLKPEEIKKFDDIDTFMKDLSLRSGK